MIYKHNSPSSTKIKINSFHAESLFYVSGHVSYIGQPERISIIGISNKSKKRIFIRDVGSNDFNFENKVSLEMPDDIDVFININSSTEVWVDIDRLDVKENQKDKYSLLIKHLKDDADINDPQPTKGKKLICSHDVQSFSVNKSSISLSFTGADSILVEGFDQNKELLLRRKIKSGVAYPTIFRTDKKSSRIDYYINEKIIADVIDNKVEHLENIFEHASSKLNDYSITAAMATYPAREHIYLDAVNSIIDQVDILYIYFNGYENIPDEILHHAKKEKIEYIISPRSTLRASGKFSWIGTIPGFHLTIDDDIIYPSDYVSGLVNEARAIDDENIIIGVHGSIFKKM
ncbi:hypothetical protein [Aeromonas dhakensis]|uniref:hypothetical protein n=1 Tax=Aeromonas dhakensis TaxID=196024 RepID=UPI003B9F249A